MPRIRTIKPSFFQSDDVSVLPLRARLTWIGLWTQCDDQGRTKDHVKLIKAAIWPLDNVSLADIEEDLTELANRGRIVRYAVGDQHYLEVTNWSEHQAIQKKTPSRIPPPPNSVSKHSRTAPVVLPEEVDSPTPGKGKEGNGREGTRARDEPARNCPRHPEGTDEPCRGCQSARERAEQWAADQRQRIADAPKCRVHRGQLAYNCSLCRAEELSPA
jgi:hypothetical protein